MEAVLFYIFSALTLGGAILTITRRSPVLAAVWLTVSLLGVAGLFLLLGAEFLFVAQILVYIGGITLLFLFVIMLVNLEASATARQIRRNWPVLVLAGGGLAAELIAVVSRYNAVPGEVSKGAGNSEAIADLLLTKYAVPFEVASVLLLVAIVGSVWMGQQRKDREL